MIKIRMSRGGRAKRPFYTIVAADSRKPRDGQFLEKLGQYDPRSKELLHAVNVEGVKAWLAKGAQLSDTVRTLFKRAGVTL